MASKIDWDFISSTIIAIVIIVAFPFASFILGRLVERTRWENMLREGEGPALIRIAELEKQALDAKKKFNEGR